MLSAYHFALPTYPQFFSVSLIRHKACVMLSCHDADYSVLFNTIEVTIFSTTHNLMVLH